MIPIIAGTALGFAAASDSGGALAGIIDWEIPTEVKSITSEWVTRWWGKANRGDLEVWATLTSIPKFTAWRLRMSLRRGRSATFIELSDSTGAQTNGLEAQDAKALCDELADVLLDFPRIVREHHCELEFMEHLGETPYVLTDDPEERDLVDVWSPDGDRQIGTLIMGKTHSCGLWIRDLSADVCYDSGTGPAIPTLALIMALNPIVMRWSKR